MVIRYNQINDTAVQIHSVASSIQAGRMMELYKNTFDGHSTCDAPHCWTPFQTRGGTALMWDNTIENGYSNIGVIYFDRVFDNNIFHQSDWGYCDGTNPWDQNSDQYGYACLDQPGRGQGDLLSGVYPNKINTVTNSVSWPHQALEPIYEWGDTITNPPTTSSVGGFGAESYVSNVIKENRDYYVGTSVFDGTKGVGSGPLSSRPTSCTPRVAYWATDQNTLYQCSSTNTWTQYYTPLTCPHPFITSGFTADANPDSSYCQGYVAPTVYTISASVGSHGSISPSGSVIVSAGSDATFTITPDSGYTISTLTIDGSSVATSTSHTFSSVAGNHTISATFSAVSVTIPSSGPTISAVSANTPGQTSTTVTWTTDIPSSSQINYGPTNAYTNNTTLDTSLVTLHSQAISGLYPGTTYHYRVQSGTTLASSTSSDYSFTTASAVTNPSSGGTTGGGSTGGGSTGGGSYSAPSSTTTISNIAVSKSGTAITISWTTLAPATTQIQYGLTNTYGSQTAFIYSFTTAHSQTITGLLANTVYHYKVLSRNTSGQIEQSADMTFILSQNNGAIVSNNLQVNTNRNSLGVVTETLFIGVSSPQVKLLQQILNTYGYTVAVSGNGSPGHESTYFGPATESALQKFQCAKLTICSGAPNINGYGSTGPKTRAALELLSGTNIVNNQASLNNTANTNSSTIVSSGQPVIFNRSLSLGSVGSDVKDLQVFLNNHGFIISYYGNGSPGHESTYFGPATQASLSRFQAAHGIFPSVGYFGPKTIQFVNSLKK
ncbi:MAG: peptidoglycan-binding protein, partial [Patescibacteria group bacterium]|nr:peptidoglycan-binding protein [Patescibacteria group bacterium]